MVSVCFHLTGSGNLQKNWKYVLSNFKPDKVYIVGVHNESLNPIPDAIVLDSLEDLPEANPVLLHPVGAVELADFQPPENPCYVFGPDHARLGPTSIETKVRIRTDGMDTMYSYIAYATLMTTARLLKWH